jgi:succinate dehydrogenase (ubiquinone) membrane anchor subunit
MASKPILQCDPALAGPVRAGLLGTSAITALGLLRLNLFGPGITACVKGLWAGKQPAKGK